MPAIPPRSSAPQDMVRTGLLVVSPRSLPRLSALLAAASGKVRERLYIRVESPLQLDAVVPDIYLRSSQSCPQLDVRVLLGSNVPPHDELIGEERPADPAQHTPKYKRVVLGGTFDRLHNGHKVLLSSAALSASEHITCGVTHNDMIIKKSLWELIEPVSHRIATAEEFVASVSDNVRLRGEPIDDPFGPSIVETDLEAIIVSQETERGGHAVNTKRQERGLSTLDVITIGLLEANDEILKETKISSSSRRREALGTLLRPPNKHSRSGPYVIGLTGGIASGKSNIAKQLKQMPGIEVIDCDILAHDSYQRGSELSKEIDAAFPGVVEDGLVDRKKLGAIVFGDKARLEQLNGIVWPALMRRVQAMITESKADVVFVEAAAIVEAGWDGYMDEVWTVFVGKEEAVKRVQNRDNASEEQALARLSAQTSNRVRLEHSHVALCSLWDYSVTRDQLHKAVSLLRERIGK